MFIAPIETADKSAQAVFGDDIDIYDLTRAVEDGNGPAPRDIADLRDWIAEHAPAADALSGPGYARPA